MQQHLNGQNLKNHKTLRTEGRRLKEISNGVTTSSPCTAPIKQQLRKQSYQLSP